VKNKESLYTTREVAELLKISYMQCIYLIRSGKIKAIRIGNNYRIPEEELQRILKEGTK